MSRVHCAFEVTSFPLVRLRSGCGISIGFHCHKSPTPTNPVGGKDKGLGVADFFISRGVSVFLMLSPARNEVFFLVVHRFGLLYSAQKRTEGAFGSVHDLVSSGSSNYGCIQPSTIEHKARRARQGKGFTLRV